MFDYGEFTRILKHGAKDPDDKWSSMSHPNWLDCVTACIIGKHQRPYHSLSQNRITSIEHCQMQRTHVHTLNGLSKYGKKYIKYHEYKKKFWLNIYLKNI